MHVDRVDGADVGVVEGGGGPGLAPLQAVGPQPVEAVEFATLEWVEWFNNRRLLTSIGDVPPAEYEQQYYRAQEAPVMMVGVN